MKEILKVENVSIKYITLTMTACLIWSFSKGLDMK